MNIFKDFTTYEMINVRNVYQGLIKDCRKWDLARPKRSK